jgi:uncharacterized protein (TIGR02217 family)
MAFFECQFPTTLSYRAIGGPGFSTVVNEGFSGYEQRNRNWANPRGKWSVSLMTPEGFAGNRQHFIDLLNAFFLVVGGKADAFRLKDHKDFRGTSQTIGTGNGSQTTFQLTKTYIAGGRSFVRTIQKPIAPPAVDYLGEQLPNTVKIYLGGTIQPATAWSVNGTTGLVTLNAAPATGVIVTADFEFHFPVRFDVDDFAVQVEESDVREGAIVAWNSIPLIEVRL